MADSVPLAGCLSVWLPFVSVQWQHYPKLLTTVLLLSSFLIGAGLMGGVQKTGIMGKGGNVRRHDSEDGASRTSDQRVASHCLRSLAHVTARCYYLLL